MSNPKLNQKEITIIINETDDLIDVLLKKNIPIKNIRKEINVIKAKYRNNKIGYARFNAGQIKLKLIICPKIFEYDTEKFLKYIKLYLDLLLKYQADLKRFNIDNSHIELAQTAKNKNSFGFDELMEQQYLNALLGIFNFFKKYKTLRATYEDHTSSELSFDLNLQQTITEIDKSKIHQYREIVDYHNFFAEIAFSTLKLFNLNSEKNFQEQIINVSKKTIRLLSSKFKLKANRSSYKKLFDKRCIKLFKTAEEVSLYTNLLTLLGKDNFFEKNHSISSNFVSEKITSVFFEANKLYELKVYEYLIKNYEKKNISFKPFKNFSLKDNTSKIIKELKSEPDFIVHHNARTLVVDAKWKQLESFDSQFIYDYLKLQRDADIFNTSECVLIYPVIKITNSYNMPLKLDTNLSSNYKLELLEVNVL